MFALLRNLSTSAANSMYRKTVLFFRIHALLAVIVIWLNILVLGASTPAIAQDASTDYQVKAAFLIKFPKYVDWPDTAFDHAQSPIIIAVADDTKLAKELQKIIEGRTVNGRKIIVQPLTAGEKSSDHHIRFISAEELRHSPKLLTRLQGTSTLTVGESDNFLENGGIINLAHRDQRIALEVNLTAAHRARLRISSQLLSVAKVVRIKEK